MLHREYILEIAEIDLRHGTVKFGYTRFEDTDHPDDTGGERVIEAAAEEAEFVTGFNFEITRQYRPDNDLRATPSCQIASLFD